LKIEIKKVPSKVPSFFKVSYSPPRHVVDAAHLCQLGIQRLGQLPQLRPVPALPGVA
jgi:hypothetical protein